MVERHVCYVYNIGSIPDSLNRCLWTYLIVLSSAKPAHIDQPAHSCFGAIPQHRIFHVIEINLDIEDTAPDIRSKAFLSLTLSSVCPNCQSNGCGPKQFLAIAQANRTFTTEWKHFFFASLNDCPH